MHFSETLRELDARVAADRGDPAVDPACLPYVAQHGARTARALVLFHGFTNCPCQFSELADAFAARGFSVYVPRLPHHGLADKMTTALAALTRAELQGAARDALRVANGLGARVSVLGLSSGGTMAAWVAATEPVDVAVAVAPLFGLRGVPQPLTTPLRALLAALPNRNVWWDPRVKEGIRPEHAYPRFPTRALAQCLQLAADTARAARRGARARSSILVLNRREAATSNAAARAVWSRFAAHGAVTREIVLTDIDRRHDIIEPVTFPQARTLVYPVLLDAVEGA
ncbi:MAG: alpha/beta hydrolase [Candidatus Velthaea sp.]